MKIHNAEGIGSEQQRVKLVKTPEAFVRTVAKLSASKERTRENNPWDPNASLPKEVFIIGSVGVDEIKLTYASNGLSVVYKEQNPTPDFKRWVDLLAQKDAKLTELAAERLAENEKLIRRMQERGLDGLLIKFGELLGIPVSPEGIRYAELTQQDRRLRYAYDVAQNLPALVTLLDRGNLIKAELLRRLPRNQQWIIDVSMPVDDNTIQLASEKLQVRTPWPMPRRRLFR